MKYVVTGGGGFIGKALGLRLRELGHDVVSISRRSYPALEERGIQCVRGDLGAESAGIWESALDSADAVFHVAAKVEMWGSYGEFFRVNVLGTRNIIACCRRRGVRKLIYTSSPSVIADGCDLNGIDESYPYPKRYKAHYPQTKAMAEREVLAANSEALWTIALRPHLIWGPGDTNFVPTILRRAKAGRLLRVGEGKNKVDLTFIEDCVSAHLCALQSLEHNPACRGRAYFISQGEPVLLWQWIDEVLQRNGLPVVSRRLNAPLAMLLAHVCERMSSMLPGRREPLLTSFLVSEMSSSHYFDISAAKKELGYQPKHSIAQAMDKTFKRAEQEPEA